METQLTTTSTNLPQSLLLDQQALQRSLGSLDPDFVQQVFVPYSKSKSISTAVSSGSPSFHDVTNFFSEKATLFWLRFHIAETFAFVGIYDKASVYQIRATAELIMQHEIFGQLTLDEFLCFLSRFKLGRYGKIYQSSRPNPQEFLMCLTPFWNELCKERGREEERRRQEQLHEERRSYQPPTPEEQAHIREIQLRLANKFNANPPQVHHTEEQAAP